MSVQIGRWQFTGGPADAAIADNTRRLAAPHGPDGQSEYRSPGVSILYYAFHATADSQNESQPLVLPSGAVLTWDGRLDNRAELIAALGERFDSATPDVSLVGAALERWGRHALPKVVGDWALSIWYPSDRCLLLARDFAGTRSLYYRVRTDAVVWSTLLAPLVQFAEGTLKLNEEYLAGWISSFPAAHLTPFEGIRSVRPGTYAVIRPSATEEEQFWSFDPGLQIRYRSDAEYEEHFRAVFFQSVRRRLRSFGPILAELSGGLDSSSIVCAADVLVSRGDSPVPPVLTISYFSNDEPDWDERPYFSEIENRRGRTGFHIDVSLQQPLADCVDWSQFAASPAQLSVISPARERLAACVGSTGSRVLLSGIGGDEFTGGAPTPIPELCDLIATAELRHLSQKLKSWALARRTPWVRDLFSATRRFAPTRLAGLSRHLRPPKWLNPRFASRNRRALTGYAKRIRFFGPLPNFQEHFDTLDVVRRQLACASVQTLPLYEKRYPFLDRDLLSFLFAIPQDQLVRPEERRSLLRRALAGIVPDLVLQRKRKAFVSRRPILDIATHSNVYGRGADSCLIERFGIVNLRKLVDAIGQVARGNESGVFPIRRILSVELWLRSLEMRGFLHDVAQRSDSLKLSETSTRSRVARTDSAG